MLGIDIYRKYQTVTDVAAVIRAGVRFAWFKGTDGRGLPVGGPADREVSQFHSRIPVGLYHYAQLGDPEGQARVLTAEVRRLRADGLPPVLDLEDPHTPGAAAADFARRFLLELKRQGFPRVALYANTSMLAGIQADGIRQAIGGVVIWAARYGSNDGANHGLGGYTGHVDVHQFTSAGRVPGITGSVDLNNAADLSWAVPTKEDDVDLNDPMRDFIWPHTADIKDTVGSTLANTQSYAKGILERLDKMDGRLAAIESRGVLDVDEAELAEALDARGVGGVSAAQMIEILNNIRVGVSVAPPTDSTS